MLAWLRHHLIAVKIARTIINCPLIKERNPMISLERTAMFVAVHPHGSGIVVFLNAIILNNGEDACRSMYSSSIRFDLCQEQPFYVNLRVKEKHNHSIKRISRA